jgi:simple sugar transport system ATP-binding protein
MHFAVEAIGMSKRFGSTQALADVNVRVETGSIHALVGRNGAGKSTLVSLLTGLVKPDAGAISFDDVPAPPYGDAQAWRRRVACVYQHSMIVPHLSVAENIFLNRQPTTVAGAIDWPQVRAEARAMLREWKLDLDVDAPGASLSVEERQLIEIVRALSYGARFVILDEPTARLEGRAIDRLFAHLRALNASGVTMLFISHHLQEIYELCDSVTVLRDGKLVCSQSVASLPESLLIEAMTGAAESGGIAQAEPRQTRPSEAGAALQIDGLESNELRDIHLCVEPGEIVGIAGITGSGKIALAETIAGLRPARSGVIRIEGRVLRSGVRDALEAGVGFVPRDRHNQGLVLDLSIEENATMTIDDRLGRFGWIDARKRREVAINAMQALDVVAGDASQAVRELSGGNQQKVVFARALARNPKVLVAVDPTAGVDVASKAMLRAELVRLRERGAAILVVSDDLDDLHACDRVAILFEGKIVAELSSGWNDNELLARMEGLDVA